MPGNVTSPIVTVPGAWRPWTLRRTRRRSVMVRHHQVREVVGSEPGEVDPCRVLFPRGRPFDVDDRVAVWREVGDAAVRCSGQVDDRHAALSLHRARLGEVPHGVVAVHVEAAVALQPGRVVGEPRSRGAQRVEVQR